MSQGDEPPIADVRVPLDAEKLAQVRGVALVDSDGNVLTWQPLDESVRVNIGNTITITPTAA
jgi:hypothetical protein